MNERSVLCRAIETTARAACLLLSLGSTVHAADVSGTEFWLAFQTNGAAGALSLQILGESGTTGSVDIAGLSFSSPFSIPAGGLTTIVLPAAAMLAASDGVEGLGVHVTASKAVVVYGLDLNAESADTFLALPIPALGVAYSAIGYAPESPFNTQFAVVATADGTLLTVTPTAAVGSHPAGMDFVVALDAGQAYQAQSTGDLTGTRILSDLPIAVFSGNAWTNVPIGVGFADHLVEQLRPTTSWGRDVFVIPSALRTAPERLRFQVRLANTTVTMSPGGDITTGPGSFVETLLSAPVRLESSQPFFASQFSIGGSADGQPGDPFLVAGLEVERFASCYLVATADDGSLFPDNFANLVVPTAAVGEIKVDGVLIPGASFTAIGTTGYSYRQLALAPGRHRLAGALAFGASVYGFGTSVSYASPAGGANPPFAAAFEDCDYAPEPDALGLAIGATATLASLASRKRRSH